MPPVQAPREEEARLGGARAEFIGSLPRRLSALRRAVEAVEQAPDDSERTNGLLRRMHAVASAARVLGFASVAEALAEAERGVRKASAAGRPPALEAVNRAIELLPSLVQGAASGPGAERAPQVFPVSVLVFGAQALADAVLGERADAGVECECTEDPARARELSRILGPDVAIIDGDREGARELLETLVGDPLVEPVPVLVVGSFENQDAATGFVNAGALRVLPKPASPEAIRRAVDELRDRAARPRTLREPLGDLTVHGLSERISTEFRRGLVDALEGGVQASHVSFGDGHDVLAAVWGAVARVRELVTVRSNGTLRFQQTGPGGAVPLAPWGADERRAGERASKRLRSSEGVSLQGRSVLVADDDPAVVWFMSGLLRAVGAEVIEAHDGRRALELACKEWPHAVISDVLMPKLDGFSLCHELKRDVAVRDVPVILLSWKEDLLQRVRELGADADGYLRKEAAASAVVERVREVLRARARVEERIQAGGEVRGRLDGLTPRLLLQLASVGERDVRISVRDAVFLFEVQVRRGRLVSLSRSSVDGEFSRGPSVLASLLGVSAGRFTVEPDASPCRVEFDGALPQLLEASIDKARTALRSVSETSLLRLRSVTLDVALVSAYLGCTPEPAKSLMRRLLDGASPRELIYSGAVAPRWLEAVLSDIARRGGVLAAELDPASIAPEEVPSAPPAPVQEVTAPLASPEEAARRLSAGTESADDGWFSMQIEPSAAPPEATTGAEPAVPEPTPDASMLVAEASLEPPAAKLPTAEPPATAQAASDAAAGVTTFQRSEPPLRVPGDAPGSPLNAEPTPPPAPDWASGPIFAFGQDAGTLQGVGVPAVAAVDAERVDTSQAGSDADVSSDARAADALDALRLERDPDPVPSGEPLRTPPLAEAAAVEASRTAPEQKAEPEPKAPVDDANYADDIGALLSSGSGEPPAVGPGNTPKLSASTAADDLLFDFGGSASQSAPPAAVSSSRPAESTARSTSSARASSPSSRSPGSRPSSPASRRVERGSNPRSSRDTGRLSPADARKSSAPPQTKDGGGWTGLVLKSLGAMVIAFFGTTWASTWFTGPSKQAARPASSAPAVAAAVPAEKSPEPAFITESKPLPGGIHVSPGQGLLEVEIVEPDAIFVDGVFIGRGPLRRAPLPAGKHTLEVRGERTIEKLEVNVASGQRTRVAARAPTPAPSATPAR
jgi:DNA-binding response OmpR family regulator